METWLDPLRDTLEVVERCLPEDIVDTDDGIGACFWTSNVDLAEATDALESTFRSVVRKHWWNSTASSVGVVRSHFAT